MSPNVRDAKNSLKKISYFFDNVAKTTELILEPKVHAERPISNFNEKYLT